MILREGDEVIYQFPLNTDKRVQGTIEFLGETVIHFKTVEGYSIKISEQHFEHIFPLEKV